MKCNCTRCQDANGPATFSSMDYWEIVGNVAYRVCNVLERAGSSFSDEDIINALHNDGLTRIENHFINKVRREHELNIEDRGRL